MSDQNNQSVYQVVMPRLGLTMTEARIVEWLKAEDAWVEKGEMLFCIENEKATLEIESPWNGYLHIQAAIGDVVQILQPVAQLRGGEKAADHHQVSSGNAKQESAADVHLPAKPVSTSAETRDEIRASPKARVLARKLNISFDGVTGSGLRGMIVAEDVERAARKTPVKASPLAQRVADEAGVDLASVAGSGAQGRIMREDVERVIQSSQTQSAAPLPLTGLRGIIAERLSQSWRERPQVTLTTEADATNLVAARQQLNAELASLGEKISYNALLIKLVAQALYEQPNINVQLTASGLQTISEINIGLAVDTERGLLVPVLRGAPQKSLRQINGEINALADRATKGHSLPDDLRGGTFTITNLGAYEIDAFTPLINPPECAILGVGRIVSKPVGLNGQIVLREMLALSLSFDHRLVDGAPAARFLQRVKQLIERPFALAL